MSESGTVARSSALVPAAALAPARFDRDELYLQPTEGLARWLGPTLHRWLFRMISMVEVPLAAQAGPVIATEAWFRRDRHRHPRIDPVNFRLEVVGVANPRMFTLEDLRALPWEERLCVMECAGNGNHVMGSAGLAAQGRFAGPSFETIVAACGGPGNASHFAFYGLDPLRPLRPAYHYGLSLEELRRARALLALTMNGEPLPRARGFPIRLVVPGIYSMSHVKWLGRIEGKTTPHRGFWNRVVFTNKERRGGRWRRVEARWIGLKSVITRCRRSDDGWHLTGWAWGGGEPIVRVDISTDAGATWHEAELEPPESYFPEAPIPATDREHCWTVFHYHWRPQRTGAHVIGARAFGADGSVQTMAEDPAIKGHFNQTRVQWRRVKIPR